jgi:transcriptional regulator PpsR
MLSTLKQHGAIRLLHTAARGEHGTTTEVELSAAGASEAEIPCIGFVVRDVGRRIAAAPQGARDLTHAVEQLTDLVGRVSLPELLRDTVDLVERHFIEAALVLTGDNRTAASELLGLSRQSLYIKLRRHKLVPADTSEAEVSD